MTGPGKARLGKVMRGAAGLGVAGAGRGEARHCAARQSSARPGLARHVAARHGPARRGKARISFIPFSRPGLAGQCLAGQCPARRGSAGLGEAALGSAMQCRARQGEDFVWPFIPAARGRAMSGAAMPGKAMLSPARPGAALHGVARLCTAGLGAARRCRAALSDAWLCWAMQGEDSFGPFITAGRCLAGRRGARLGLALLCRAGRCQARHGAARRGENDPNSEGNEMKIHITVEGITPLLCNRFSDEAAAAASEGSRSSAAGADRGTPLEIAEKKLYRGLDGKPMIPQPNLLRSIVDGGTFHKSGRSKITTQKSSLIFSCLDIEGAEVPIIHKQPWKVDTRAVRIPATGGRILAHRPMFDDWQLAFVATLDTSIMSVKLLRLIVDDAGKKIGLGDFRPNTKGPYGRYQVIRWLAVSESDDEPGEEVAEAA